MVCGPPTPEITGLVASVTVMVWLQLAVLPNYAELVPGLGEVIAALRQRGLRIAATTGYFPEATKLVLELAARQGFVPDCAVGADDVKSGPDKKIGGPFDVKAITGELKGRQLCYV